MDEDLIVCEGGPRQYLDKRNRLAELSRLVALCTDDTLAIHHSLEGH